MPHLSSLMTHVPSVAAGGQRINQLFSHQDAPRLRPYTAPSITPYLGLRSRLSQIWINRWSILLLLVLVRTLLAVATINDGIGSSRREALSACSSVEAMGSAMVSMPHYMSRGMNEVTASGIEKAVNGLMQMSTLAVSAVEEIVIFVINMMTSTYLCLITFAVTGSLRAVLEVMDAAQNQLNDMTKNLGDDMASVLKNFNDAYNKVRDTLKGGVLGIGGGISLPSLDVNGDIQKLRDLKLPASLGDDIKKLNNSLPDFKQVQQTLNNVIRIPFEEIKKLINESMGTFQFDRSVFPVPQKEQLQFCGDDDGVDSFFNHLLEIVVKVKTILLGLLIAGAILACIPMTWREIRRWRQMKERSQLVGSGEHDAMDVVYLVSRPYTSSAGLKLSTSTKNERRQTLIRWIVAYATTDAALFVLSLAIAGLFSCLCQYVLFKSVEKEVPGLADRVGDFTEKIVVKLESASQDWALNTNKVIMDTNNTINQDLFGWVNKGTTAVNDTLNEFVNITNVLLDKTFGDGPLRDPIQEVLNCLVLLKVAGLQKGLTWVHDHAHINLPLMANDTFSLGAMESLASDKPADESFLANPGDKAADKISSVVASFLGKIYAGIRQEAIISAMILIIWLAIVFIAIIRGLSLWFGSERVRGEGGAAPITCHVPEASKNYDLRDFHSNDQDRYRNFDDVPLNHHTHNDEHVQGKNGQQHSDAGLPTYHTAVSGVRTVHNSHHDTANAPGNTYTQDQVLERNMNPPFATEMRGAQTFTSAEQASNQQTTTGARGRRAAVQSYRASIWDGDSKI